MPRLFVFDAMGLVYRAYHALLVRDRQTGEWGPLRNSRGEPTSAIHGFGNTVLKIRREERPDFWALAWDGHGPTFRHELFTDYKATRKPTPDDLLVQVPVVRELAGALGLPVLEMPGHEADDVMATLARRGEQEGFEVALVTSDKDMVQLVTDRVRLLSPVGRGEDYTWVDSGAVRQKWHVDPFQTRDVLALMGDTSDNVPGVPGVGEKTATDLIATFGTLDELYAHLDRVTKPALREKLAANRERAFLSRELVTVRTDCDLPFEWDDLRCGPVLSEALLEIARRYDLRRLESVAQSLNAEEARGAAPAASQRRRSAGVQAPPAAVATSVEPPPASAPPPVAPAAPVPPPPVAAVPRGIQSHLDLWTSAETRPAAPTGLSAWTERLHEIRARSPHGIAILPVATGGDARRARLAGLALAARNGVTTYLPLGHSSGPNFSLEQVRSWIGLLLGDSASPKVEEDVKRDAHLLESAGVRLSGAVLDTRVASFLCDPSRAHGVAECVRDFLGERLPSIEDHVAAVRARGGRITAADLPPEDMAAVAEPLAAALLPLGDALRAQLEARSQWKLYKEIEHPLIRVLREMERAGIRVDTAALATMAERAGTELARLEEELHRLAGETLNLNSGPQLARILFDVLRLTPGRRTKTGYSTDQAVLEELATVHEFPARLLEYRTLSKLKSTYLDALPLTVDPADGRIHTTFDQTGAATGRLSSSNPNLQNIPMRTPQGREIRHAFVAAPDCLLVGADYSQIELRLMAHLSGDANLIAAFQGGEDIHEGTARRIFGVPEGPLDPALRSRAKIVNFGIMYGMGPRSLSQQMGIGLPEAQEFIASYFRVFARVREYLDACLEEARRRGYVETLFGRRRYLAGLASSSGAERSFAERAAINAPIQGSAADLMKLAMIRVHRSLKQSFPSARLLLQVHDELLLECPAVEAEEVAARVRHEMESAFPLRVPLEVSVGRGSTWFDVH